MFAQSANAGANTASDTRKTSSCSGKTFARRGSGWSLPTCPLTATEATKFWPIYDQYAAEVSTLGDARVALIKEYAQSYNTMTDAQANDLMNTARRPSINSSRLCCSNMCPSSKR